MRPTARNVRFGADPRKDRNGPLPAFLRPCNVGAMKPSQLAPIAGLMRPLTHAERRVAVLVAQGLTNPRIAVQLGIKERTVKAHITSAAAKLAESGLVPGELSPKQRLRLFLLRL